jgi:UDP-N-acetylmuramoylalanine--D-glutamate ligase
MAFVREYEGVRYYDDSKGTNVGAVVTALAGLAEDKCVLIAGGKDKGGGYADLARALPNKGRAVVVIGEAADAIQKELAAVLPVERAVTMDAAVLAASKLARPGDAVLLSPACSSFDMFRDYKHRGDVFVAAVNALGHDAQERP